MLLNLGRQLSEAGVMGINKRNGEYISLYNDRKNYPLVDDKLKTKILAEQAGIPVTELYGVIEAEGQIRALDKVLSGHTDFAIKPAHGSGGDGIEVIVGRTKDLFKKANGQIISEDQLKFHISNILSGLFSLGGLEDQAIIEYRVKFDEIFDAISYQGVPDIRIIVYKGIPVMAMIRLPTYLSGGKANLHQGAIGVGIDLANGRTLTAVWKNSVISEHPDTRHPVTGFQIPNWEQLLIIAARCYELTGLGYLGVDIVLDRAKGPLVLEMNARPGLNIQIANQMGLLHRLRFIDANAVKMGSYMDRVSFSRRILPRIQ
ncbi:MAG: alpha-L-glutamate ligase-like protein [Gammaproteobacteria bacterium]|nr:alpha-L-glutamate ligase-like protein [Gammaproteobacteria bacterium]NIO61717.1 alpha-L-glutamate ligase-like protein [Gammaproteobacteria bacterium]NIQ18968.1 alpha-L-glutamate ligase-like protein [Gammaproteobacteria bacterium]NIT05017.1 alpha-L-glutamate ligase-like protein [Gammaproteobacteria bacterium]NIT40390.1 alpha-L-glutamate ligase-like protein [Gammaproteobacteria bacterium]